MQLLYCQMDFSAFRNYEQMMQENSVSLQKLTKFLPSQHQQEFCEIVEAHLNLMIQVQTQLNLIQEQFKDFKQNTLSTIEPDFATAKQNKTKCLSNPFSIYVTTKK